MATFEQMTQRLSRRFDAVNALPIDAVTETLEDTFTMFGYQLNADVPLTDYNKLLSYASAELATQIAINAASYFRFTDGEESVDKTMISKEYRELAKIFRDEYQDELAVQDLTFKSSFAVMPRRDRL